VEHRRDPAAGGRPRRDRPGPADPRIINLPGDLLRHELLMTLQPVPEKTIREIVDEVFLPLVSVG